MNGLRFGAVVKRETSTIDRDVCRSLEHRTRAHVTIRTISRARVHVAGMTFYYHGIMNSSFAWVFHQGNAGASALIPSADGSGLNFLNADFPVFNTPSARRIQKVERAGEDLFSWLACGAILHSYSSRTVDEFNTARSFLVRSRAWHRSRKPRPRYRA